MTIYKASCHCDAVKYQVEGTLENLIECNCSICSTRAHILWFVPLSAINFEGGKDHLTSYKFGNKHLNHRSCQTCSTAMFSHGEYEGSEKAGINIRTFADIDLTTLDITQYDGKAL
ncbi:MAG: aldehyde-activating protein [Hyphomicrobiales bacterium]|nr:MAG: aldehyde-activating protein [Hyphomicrobiales bacterium]